LTARIEDAQRRQAEGFRMLGIGADTWLLIRSIRESLAALRST
jgi:hypothetical protein